MAILAQIVMRWGTMATKKTRVHASYAKWSYTLDQDGELVECKGVFPAGEKDHALGAARYFHKAYISDPDAENPRKPEIYSDACVVTLRADQGDRLEKFQHWAEEHNLMPGLQEAQEHIYAMRKQDLLMDELIEQEKSSLAYKPVAERFVKDTINHMNWQMLEAGYPTGDKPNQQAALVTSTDHPQLAFQAAFYLHKEGYMNASSFYRLNQEIKQQVKHPQDDVEFRIVVEGSQIDKFNENFPKAGHLKAALGEYRLQRLAELSEPDAGLVRK